MFLSRGPGLREYAHPALMGLGTKYVLSTHSPEKGRHTVGVLYTLFSLKDWHVAGACPRIRQDRVVCYADAACLPPLLLPPTFLGSSQAGQAVQGTGAAPRLHTTPGSTGHRVLGGLAGGRLANMLVE